MKDKVNYNKIAQNYDQRYLKNPHQGVLNTLRRILSQENIQKVLEVGCGTSHWLKALSSFKSKRLFGIDSSFGMLQSPGKSATINLCQAKAEFLPISQESFDLLFCINAFHHFENQREFIKESHRVLSRGGTVAIIGMDPSDARNKWYVYKYFEGTYERDLGRFPSWSQTKYWLIENGFEDIHFEDVEIIHDPKLGKAVLEDPFLRKTSCSQLILLSELEYKKGLAKVEAAVNNDSSNQEEFQNDIILSMMIGKKPC